MYKSLFKHTYSINVHGMRMQVLYFDKMTNYYTLQDFPVRTSVINVMILPSDALFCFWYKPRTLAYNMTPCNTLNADRSNIHVEW